MIYVLDYTFLYISGYLWLPLDIYCRGANPFILKRVKSRILEYCCNVVLEYK